MRRGQRYQPGASAALSNHEGLRDRGPDAVAQLADHRVHVCVHKLRWPGHFHQVPGLQPDQVGFLDYCGLKSKGF